MRSVIHFFTMHPMLKPLITFPLFLAAWVFLFMVWIGTELGNGPLWITLLCVASGMLLLTGWLSWFFSSRKWFLPRIIGLSLGGTGLAVLLAMSLVVEPWQSRQRQMANNRFLHTESLETALERLDCPSGKTLVIAPRIRLLSDTVDRQLVDLWLLPANPVERPRLLASTIHDGSVTKNPAWERHVEEVAACAGSAEELDSWLDRMATLSVDRRGNPAP